jgi:hypothetical protein
MKIVIQCAGRKEKHAGHMRTQSGAPVLFVARPSCAPPGPYVHAHPDTVGVSAKTWRQSLVTYNEHHNVENPLGLLPAYKLYANDTYRALAKHVGVSNLYVLSAGWGLIAATFLTPCYDITFSPKAKRWARRNQGDEYADLNMLSNEYSGNVLFFGGKDYLPLFSKLTVGYKSQRIALYSSMREPVFADVKFIRFQTNTQTNWHYEAVKDFLTGHLEHLLGFETRPVGHGTDATT